MPVEWHPNRLWDWCVSKDEKKEIDPIFIEELKRCMWVVYLTEILKHFASWGIETFWAQNLQRFWTISVIL